MARNLSEYMGTPGDVGGKLQQLWAKCWIRIPGGTSDGDLVYNFRTVPEISDSKTANYNSQTIFGRSSPIRSFSDSSARTIGVGFELYNTDPDTRQENFRLIRALAVAVHPKYGGTYDPPPICQFNCGNLLSGEDENDRVNTNTLQCLIMNYNFNYGRESMFDDGMMPFHISGSFDLEVIHSQLTLPGRDEVLKGQF